MPGARVDFVCAPAAAQKQLILWMAVEVECLRDEDVKGFEKATSNIEVVVKN